MAQAGARFSWRLVFPRQVASLCLLVIAVQAVLIGALARTAGDEVPREAPVAILTAPVVAQSLADQANAMKGHPFDARVAVSAETARSNLRVGSVVAVLEVNLRGTQDELLLNEANGDQLNQAVRDRIDVVEKSYDRTTVVRHVDTSSGQIPLAHRLTYIANAIGFLFVVLISLWLGAVTRRLGRGLLRHVALAGTALVCAGV
ncbi:MAG: hypothetical protein L0H31_11750, partial [Nocardioidaceae bacterium]|nr:hypothetical protein [Nocardioidaceae bacterium]